MGGTSQVTVKVPFKVNYCFKCSFAVTIVHNFSCKGGDSLSHFSFSFFYSFLFEHIFCEITENLLNGILIPKQKNKVLCEVLQQMFIL